MLRLIKDDLTSWRESKYRKPLLLLGARQVGKTWALEDFGKDFPDGFVRINFDHDIDYKDFFRSSKDVKRIIQNLSFATGRKITPGTLLIFDEIQECPDALNSLKYFCEDAPEYYVAGAGSLLGLLLASGFPVGKVDFLGMGPMTFEEFLLASGEKSLFDFIKSVDRIDRVPLPFHNRLTELLKIYYVTGGMPEVVNLWVNEQNSSIVDKKQSDILMAYERDFAKHAEKSDVPKITLIWDSLPSQLSKENKKFLYSAVKEGARAREYENALMWLKNAELIKKVPRISKPELPLSAYEDLSAFKIYMGDVGLLRRHSMLSSTAFAEQNRLFTEFKGALTENFVLQSLINMPDVRPYYWTDYVHEVDFIIQIENEVFPIEVKAAENVVSKSLKAYRSKFEKQTALGVRISLKNLSLDGTVLNVPLYMTDELLRLIKLT